MTLASRARRRYVDGMRRGILALLAAGSCVSRSQPPAPAHDLDGAPANLPTGTIAGAVRDVATGEPVPLAEVQAERIGGHRRAVDTSDTAGGFTLVLPAGRYRVTASYGSLR